MNPASVSSSDIKFIGQAFAVRPPPASPGRFYPKQTADINIRRSRAESCLVDCRKLMTKTQLARRINLDAGQRAAPRTCALCTPPNVLSIPDRAVHHLADNGLARNTCPTSPGRPSQPARHPIPRCRHRRASRAKSASRLARPGFAAGRRRSDGAGGFFLTNIPCSFRRSRSSNSRSIGSPGSAERVWPSSWPGTQDRVRRRLPMMANAVQEWQVACKRRDTGRGG